MTTLADRVWPEVPDQRAVVLVPVGSTEQHGPHLPLDTDTVIAQAVCRRVVQLLEDPELLIASALAFGSSGEHQHFPGTVSIGTETLRLVAIELVRSLRTWARRVVFVNGHGGNVAALAAAVDQLRGEGHDVAWLPCATEDVDLHAGFTETSLLLHLCPGRVRLDAAAAGNTLPLDAILPTLMQQGVRAVSANGVLGDPAGASADEGARVLEVMARRVAAGVS
jgi:mycofactocin system creatininase family protein